MNFQRFIRKCMYDRPAAWRSIKLLWRTGYGRLYWTLWPRAPIRCRVSGGQFLLLEPGHSFTGCFWPAVENYEPDVCAALHRYLRPGSRFIDCGANIGYFSVIAGGITGPAGRVLSVEANPVTFRLLERNLDMNRMPAPVHCALTSQPGSLQLFVPRMGGDVYSCLRKGGLVQGDNVDCYDVPGRTLDDVVAEAGLDRADVVKIDVEGAELDVLRSGRRTLEEFRPVVICEYGTNTWPSFGATPADLLHFLAALEYDVGVFDASRGCVQPADDATWSSPYANLILSPRG